MAESARSVKPVPDPTALTTEALHREIATLEKVIGVRLDAMDKAMTLFQESLTRTPTEIEKQIDHLRKLTDETFRIFDQKHESVQLQFRERDVRTEQTQKDSKVAVDAALSAQKEAAGAANDSNAAVMSKTEAAFTKQIDAITELIRTTAGGWDRQIGDMKDRLTRIESEYVGRTKEVAVQATDRSQGISVLAIVVAFVGVVLSILAGKFL